MDPGAFNVASNNILQLNMISLHQWRRDTRSGSIKVCLLHIMR